MAMDGYGTKRAWISHSSRLPGSGWIPVEQPAWLRFMGYTVPVYPNTWPLYIQLYIYGYIWL